MTTTELRLQLILLGFIETERAEHDCEVSEEPNWMEHRHILLDIEVTSFARGNTYVIAANETMARSGSREEILTMVKELINDPN